MGGGQYCLDWSGWSDESPNVGFLCEYFFLMIIIWKWRSCKVSLYVVTCPALSSIVNLTVIANVQQSSELSSLINAVFIEYLAREVKRRMLVSWKIWWRWHVSKAIIVTTSSRSWWSSADVGQLRGVMLTCQPSLKLPGTPRFPHVYTTAPSTLPRLGVIVSSLCKIASSHITIYSIEIPQVVPNRKPGSEPNWLQIQMRGTNPT